MTPADRLDPVDAVTASRAATVVVDGLRFRDLDHDGELAPYEDWRRPVPERIADLLSRMTVAEKAGTLLHATLHASDGPLAVMGAGSEYDLGVAADLVHRRAVTSAITRLATTPAAFADQNNHIQDIAAESRLGIPMTISSDPRHHVGEMFGASVANTGFTAWPGPLGLAATGDPDLVRRFGDCVRREYRSVGIHMSLAPQADLGTTPLWPRFSGTFGDDPQLVRSLVGAYVEGAQGGREGLHADSVVCIVKHWVGYGASRDGFDGHSYYGRFSAFPTEAFDDHVDAFRDAFDANVAGVMPTYNILEGVEVDGVPLEPVGAGFSAPLIDHLLRRQHGFDGLVLSDWGITRDFSESCRIGEPPQGPDTIAMCWGVEDRSRTERFATTINAGVDQIGGEDDPQPLLDALASGAISAERLDQAVARVLTHKFELGLFERPFVGPGAAAEVVGASAADADDAHRRAVVVLDPVRRPLVSPDDVVHADEPIAGALRAAGVATTDDIGAATRAVALTSTPHQLLHPGHFFGRLQHEGDLDFDPDGDEFRRLDAMMSAVPTIVVVHMDRPAIVTPFVGGTEAIVVELGVSPAALVDMLIGRSAPTGHLPFELPRSMDDVRDAPCDRAGHPLPLFDRGDPQAD